MSASSSIRPYPVPAARESEQSATILVVEDDEPIRLALREVLEAEGYQVIVAEDGAEAMQVLSREVPSLIITDLHMPNLDGMQLCDNVRADLRTEQIPIIVLTAEYRPDRLRARVDALIRKPFDIDALLATIAQFVRPTLLPRVAAAPPSVRLSLRPRKQSFTLYVSQGSSASERAERTVRRVLADKTLEVVDIVANPERARVEGVAMTPTLISTFNGAREVFLGDLSEAMLVEEFASGN